jgi:hypothetical protein
MKEKIFALVENKIIYRCECGKLYNLNDNEEYKKELPENTKWLTVAQVPKTAYERAVIFAGKCC